MPTLSGNILFQQLEMSLSRQSSTTLFILLYILSLIFGIQAAEDLPCPIPGGKTKDVAPDSLCTSYYTCNGEIATKIPCPGGSLFDADKQDCIVSKAFKCKDE
ncbi:hypothetical protein K492DRAFT_197628 [Lichtheimia hyalospora FSU 10163]|nr:hypothetical protein K492DRAFT_197628 [Lichtheimia hyalospora FSU 10163]